jgi:hypothetical protein
MESLKQLERLKQEKATDRTTQAGMWLRGLLPSPPLENY